MAWTYNRIGSKNPNWKGGISKTKLKCKQCNSEFIGISMQKFCSFDCSNSYQIFSRAIRIRRLNMATEFAIKILPTPPKYQELPHHIKNVIDKNRQIRAEKAGRPHKKYYCEKCGKNEVIRRTKFCKECRPKRFELHIICKYCGKPAIKYKGEGEIFCNRECQLKSYVGEGNPHFIDGKANERTRLRGSKEYAKWRESVLNRDNHTCVICGVREKSMHADHIKQFALYPKLRFEVSNGRTLCAACHKKTDTYLSGGRKKIDYLPSS